METTLLDKDMIAQPELWRMMLSVTDRTIDVALYPPTAREELVWRTFELDGSAPSRLKAIEDVVYDNPLLLSDFKSVGCVVDCGLRAPVPAEAGEVCAARVLAEMWSDELPDDAEVELYDTGCSDARIALVIDPELRAFLTRTFFNIRFVERKAALCRYFASHPEGISPRRVYGIFSRDVVTVIAMDGDRLLMANDFRYRTAYDAAYYLLASMRSLGLDADSTDVVLHGHPDGGERVEPVLRRFVNRVRAIPFPMLRYRVSKSTLQAPFDLLICTQCE